MHTIFSESIGPPRLAATMHHLATGEAGFNPAPPYLMHIDLNSCFASVEQQANPHLRGKPVVVAAYATGGGCILAASREAKKLGIKTGLRVRDGQAIYPDLVVLPPDPNKYRFVNRKLLSLLEKYSSEVEVKSIDEMVVDFRNSSSLERYHVSSIMYYGKKNSIDDFHDTKYIIQDTDSRNTFVYRRMLNIAGEIKQRIKSEIGEWLTVSIGIAPNRFLAKTASELHKPDGLDVITGKNIIQVLEGMKLEDLCGIKSGNGGRLRLCGISSAIEFYRAGIKQLKSAFHSIVGYHWWLRLHGYEADDRQFGRKSFGHSYALYKPYRRSEHHLDQILYQLSVKMGRRLRNQGYTAGGIHVACFFSDGSLWHRGRKLPEPLFAGDDLYKAAQAVLRGAPDNPIRLIAVSCFNLADSQNEQLGLYGDSNRKKSLTRALDAISDRWGEGTVTSGLTLGMESQILDRISFGGVKGLEEFVFRESVEYESVDNNYINNVM